MRRVGGDSLKYLKVVGEWALVIGLAIGLSLLLRNFVMDVRVVPTGSMIPTIQEQDRVIVDRLFYRMGALRRGDVIVFTAPDKPELRDFSRQDLVKRLIGLPGETVEVNGGYVWVDGQALNEPYVNAGVTAGKYGPVQVPEGYCFVLGDNRGGSNDSRIWGCLEQRLIIGRVWIRHWPLDSFGPLTKPPDDYMIESAALGLCERWRPF
jgi:signal peptidase I